MIVDLILLAMDTMVSQIWKTLQDKYFTPVFMRLRAVKFR